MPTPFRPQLLVALVGTVLVIGALVWNTAAGPRIAANTSSGTYVEAIVGAPRFLNPLLASTDADIDLTHLIFSGLTRVDEHGEIILDLAQSYEVRTDSLVYTFTLKP